MNASAGQGGTNWFSPLSVEVPMPRFTLMRQGVVERSLTLMIDDIAIGRRPGTAIELSSPTVSRQHARIRRRDDGFVLEDAGSVNGVYLGGARVKAAALSAGAAVRIEEWTIVFEPEDALYAEGLHASRQATQPGVHLGMTLLSVGRFGARDVAS